jgi:predicted membrane protein
MAIALTLLWGGVLLWGVLTAEISAKMKVCVLTLLAIAFAIPSAMGFSPTVWASNLRTMMPCEFLLVGLGMGIFGLSCCSRDDLWKVLYCCLIIQVVPIAKLILGINPV